VVDVRGRVSSLSSHALSTHAVPVIEYRIGAHGEPQKVTEMKPIQIAVTVPLKVAIAAGRAEYGDAAVVLDATTIARLSPGARALIAGATDGADGCLYLNPEQGVMTAKPLQVTEATVGAVVAAMEALAVEHESRTRQKVAQQLAVQAEMEAAREAAAKYAVRTGIDSLEQAAEEDYDVAGAVSKHVMETIVLEAVKAWRLSYLEPAPEKPATRHPFGSDQMTVLAHVREWDAAFAEMELMERPAPCARSFVVQDNLTELANRAAILLPRGWTLEVSRIMRYRARSKRRCDCGKGCPKCAAHTVVAVTLNSVLTQKRVLVIEAE
jgi:hypothetical protein